ncbi:hypothetical protein AMTR_s00070p00154860 [Amborella trichopoda]|uniref:Uncharacterized protein n=1 Tax=Amborella trichopoda TaxID=13333 RepID=U5DEL2_AMBTC|nr:hypothetical protein AMTR_s00070p00154860 [Amborella trichopoda]
MRAGHEMCLKEGMGAAGQVHGQATPALCHFGLGLHRIWANVIECRLGYCSAARIRRSRCQDPFNAKTATTLPFTWPFHVSPKAYHLLPRGPTELADALKAPRGALLVADALVLENSQSVCSTLTFAGPSMWGFVGQELGPFDWMIERLRAAGFADAGPGMGFAVHQ